MVMALRYYTYRVQDFYSLEGTHDKSAAILSTLASFYTAFLLQGETTAPPDAGMSQAEVMHMQQRITEQMVYASQAVAPYMAAVIGTAARHLSGAALPLHSQAVHAGCLVHCYHMTHCHHWCS